MENATRYQLQIARDDTFKDLVVDTMVDTPGFRWDELPNVVYHWRVRSFDADERPSQWSAPRAISAAAAAPEARAPAPGAQLDCRFEGVELAVEPQAVFKEYVLQVAEEPTFAGNVQQQQNATGRFKVVLAPGVWHWRVHAIDVAGRQTESTPARALTVQLGAPRPRPTPDVVLGPREVTLAWEDVPCASRYQVEAVLESDPPVTLSAGGTSTNFKPARAGEYRWRVSGLDARGAPGPFGAWTVFRARLPGPKAAGDVSGREVTLSWAPQSGASGYRVEISAGSDFKPLLAQAVVEGNAHRPEPLPPGLYFWRVLARDQSGRWSMPSEVRRWAVPDLAAPAAPELLVPAAGRVARPDDGALEVRWSEVPGASSYDLQLDAGPVLSKAQPMHFFTNVPPGNHAVRVRARGPGGTPSPWAVRELNFGKPAFSRFVAAPARVALGGKQAVLVLRAIDDEGGALPVGRMEVRADKGRIGAVTPRQDAVEVEYTPPPLSARTATDVLRVQLGAFEGEVKVPLERGVLAVAANVGGRSNFGSVTSPTLDVGLVYIPGWLSRRLNAELRVGFYAMGAKVELPQGFAVDVGAQLLPLSVLLGWTQPLFGFELRATAGFAVQLAFVQLDGVGSFTLAPSLDVGLGVALPLGPGALEARLQYLWGRIDTDVRFQAGGIGLTLGYRIDLPAFTP